MDDTPARSIMLDFPTGVDRPAADSEESGHVTTVNGPHDLPAVLHDDLGKRWRQALLAEHRPIGPTERALVNQLARHAVAGELWEAGGGAVARQLAQLLPTWGGASGRPENATADSVLATVATADATDRCERHSRSCGRAFLKTLATLTTLQAARRERERSGRPIPPGFVDEAACEEYLADRFRSGAVRCACGSTAGYPIESRRCWECRDCGRQLGYRHGSVMAHSPLALLPWFEAIRLMLWRPELGAAELADRIGVSRLTTVRGMMQRIQAALESERVAQELADLAEHYAVGIAPVPGERAFRSRQAEPVHQRQEREA